MLDTALVAPKTTTARKEAKELHLEEESIRLLGELVRLISDCKYIKANELTCWHSHRCIQARTCERAPKKTQQPEVVMPVPTQNQVPAPTA